MKITIKTLQQKAFTIEAEETETIGDLKAKISIEQSHAVTSQKLIYSGKILSDDTVIKSCGLKEKDFLVLMVAKSKAAPATSASTSATPAAAHDSSAPPAHATTPTPTPAESNLAAAPTLSAADTPLPAGLGSRMHYGQPPTFGELSAFLSGDVLRKSIESMIEMGFPREQVLRAMHASYNNPDRAAEYLFNGIPAHLEQASARPASAAVSPAPAVQSAATTNTPASAAPFPVVPAPTAHSTAPQNLFQLAQQQQQQAAGGGGSMPGGAPTELDIEALRNNPQIAQLRQILQNNPSAIQPLIQQLAESNPAIAAAIAQNPELLTQILGIGPGSAGGEGEDSLPPGTQVINVTEEERDAIARLEALGFPRQAAIEAYFACEKNEELAANYLFEGGFDD